MATTNLSFDGKGFRSFKNEVVPDGFELKSREFTNAVSTLKCTNIRLF